MKPFLLKYISEKDNTSGVSVELTNLWLLKRKNWNRKVLEQSVEAFHGS